MIYQVNFTTKALRDIDELRKAGQKGVLAKLEALTEELKRHPYSGTGQVEQLKGNMRGYYSRRLDHGNRLVYKVEERIVTVTVASAKGHYGDK